MISTHNDPEWVSGHESGNLRSRGSLNPTIEQMPKHLATPLARNLARVWGSLWIVANCWDAWRVVWAIVSIQDPIRRLGFVVVGATVVAVVFYSAVQVIALKPLIRRHLKILLFVSLIPVLVEGIIPSELLAWMFLGLLPSMALLELFKPSGKQCMPLQGADNPQ